jgi:hypothetical protein
MSFNLLLTVEQEDHEGAIRSLLLIRVDAGITYSATMSKGEKIEFPCGIQVEIMDIIHCFSPPGGFIAPVSTAYCRPFPNKPLADFEISALMKDGFVDR